MPAIHMTSSVSPHHWQWSHVQCTVEAHTVMTQVRALSTGICEGVEILFPGFHCLCTKPGMKNYPNRISSGTASPNYERTIQMALHKVQSINITHWQVASWLHVCRSEKPSTTMTQVRFLTGKSPAAPALFLFYFFFRAVSKA
jgi:hypothetical protein